MIYDKEVKYLKFSPERGIAYSPPIWPPDEASEGSVQAQVVFDTILKVSREPQKLADLLRELPQSKKREEPVAEIVCRPRPVASVGPCLAPPRSWRFQVSRNCVARLCNRVVVYHQATRTLTWNFDEGRSGNGKRERC